MLCESLIILLVEGGIIPKEQVIDAIENVIEVKREIAGTTESIVVSMASIGLLRALMLSISSATAIKPTIVPEPTRL